MINGIYHNPTTIFFGKGMETRVGEEVAKYSKKALLHFGGDSFKKYGLYDKVVDSLRCSKVEFVELGGVKPNPRASLVYKGIDLCRKEHIDFVLAVGGGSVIDSAKAISVGVPWQGDFFDFFYGKQIAQEALRVATILTIPGSGSESSAVSVITHEKKGLKLTCYNTLLNPVFSILNPELTFSLDAHRTSSGIADAVSHILERYFTNTTYVDCTDRICEGLFKTLLKYAVLVKDKPQDYDVRAEIMWACKLAHDNSAGFGRKQDWACHNIAHELGAIYDVSHGAILSVLFPAWMQYVYKRNTGKFIQFASEFFDIDANSVGDEQAIILAIDKLKHFLKTIGMQTNLREMGIREKTHFPEIARNCVRFMQSGTIGNFVRLAPDDIVNVLNISY